MFVQPETVIRWQRTAWRRYWTWKSRRSAGPGRPQIPKEVRELIRRLAGQNPRWGSVRILGELRKLGYDVSAQTVRRYRQRAMRRPPSQSWRTFLRNHAPHIWATDFFTVQTLTLKTLYVSLFISHDRRQLVHLNVTPHPRAEWVWQQLIEATPRGQQPKFLIRDRDCCYGGSFNARAARLGIEAILTPIRAPKANAIAERLIGTLRREWLDHLDRHQREAPSRCAAGVRDLLQQRATSPHSGSRDLHRATCAGWPAAGRADRCPAGAGWTTSRVRMAGRLTCFRYG